MRCRAAAEEMQKLKAGVAAAADAASAELAAAAERAAAAEAEVARLAAALAAAREAAEAGSRMQADLRRRAEAAEAQQQEAEAARKEAEAARQAADTARQAAEAARQDAARGKQEAEDAAAAAQRAHAAAAADAGGMLGGLAQERDAAAAEAQVRRLWGSTLPNSLALSGATGLVSDPFLVQGRESCQCSQRGWSFLSNHAAPTRVNLVARPSGKGTTHWERHDTLGKGSAVRQRPESEQTNKLIVHTHFFVFLLNSSCI